jgi:hypothetical protein
LNQLLGGSTIQTANLEKKKNRFCFMPTKCMELLVWWTLQWTDYMLQKRATLGREKEKEHDMG